jgi:voltage-gated potassium channel
VYKNRILIKILGIIIFISFVVFLGSLGYYFIEGYPMLDAVYMTIITLTTTGFGEVIPLSEKGKIFTMFLLLVGMGIVTYSISSLISYIFSIDFSIKRRERMEKRISQFKNHTIVCGYGRMGEIICKKLNDEGVPFVVIEQREHLIKMLEKAKFHYIEGDASNDENLEKAAIKQAKVLVSVIDSDSDGLYITLAARSFNPGIHIIARANEQNAKKRMIRAGANKVVLPFVMSGLRVAESIINPAVEAFLSLEDIQNEGSVHLGDLHITPDSTIVGSTIGEIGPSVDNLIIVGIRKKDQSFIFSPRGKYQFEEDDCIIVMAEQEHYLEMKKRFNLSTHGFYDTKAERESILS